MSYLHVANIYLYYFMSKEAYLLRWVSIDEDLPDPLLIDTVIAFVPERGSIVVAPTDNGIWETIKVEDCNMWSGVSRITFERQKQKKCLPLATHWMITPSEPD